jgi:hypothetical protein
MTRSLDYFLQWHFTPKDYFEEDGILDVEGLRVTFGSGIAETHIPRARFDSDKEIRERLHNAVRKRFLMAQVLTHLPFVLSSPSLARWEEAGNLAVFMFPLPANVEAIVPPPDLVLTDASGKIVRDTRAERIGAKREMGAAAAVLAQSDPLFSSLLESYSKAVEDPTNELVHLFEIKEALATHFGGEAQLSSILQISRTRISEFGGICNHSVLSQGRHRGKSIVSLRWASESELALARAVAKEFIVTYLKHETHRRNG